MRSAHTNSRQAAQPADHLSETTTIQWNDTAAIAARRLRDGSATSLTVMADGRAIGKIRLADLERAEKNGNWLGAVMVHDLMRSFEDSCN